MDAEFDDYTNDWLYLRDITSLSKLIFQSCITQAQSEKVSPSSTFTVGNQSPGTKTSSASGEAPVMLVSSLARSRSIGETLQEVKMVQAIFFRRTTAFA
ncbi:hypothetical protein MLD38_030907 [Melastoma candidum]|uniref:Uncharacterized protein n=1 Tax=Melastoma candidum TaxID=119954 RepID=A0ACB9MQ12_9MYRT|nr:hypothetical protein MLD38_030907 [Melastoma candidum]